MGLLMKIPNIWIALPLQTKIMFSLPMLLVYNMEWSL